MQVRLTRFEYGPGYAWEPGQVVDLPAPAAKALIDRGAAEPVAAVKTIETAALRTAKPRGKKRGIRNAIPE